MQIQRALLAALVETKQMSSETSGFHLFLEDENMQTHPLMAHGLHEVINFLTHEKNSQGVFRDDQTAHTMKSGSKMNY